MMDYNSEQNVRFGELIIFEDSQDSIRIYKLTVNFVDTVNIEKTFWFRPYPKQTSSNSLGVILIDLGMGEDFYYNAK